MLNTRLIEHHRQAIAEQRRKAKEKKEANKEKSLVVQKVSRGTVKSRVGRTLAGSGLALFEYALLQLWGVQLK